MGEYAIEFAGRGLANGGDEEGAGFEGRVVGIGEIEDGELRARRLAEPALKERRNERSGGGPTLDGRFVRGEDVERGVGSRARSADGKEEAGSFKAKSRLVEAGGSDAGDLRAGGLRLRERDRHAMAVDKGDGGRLAVGEFTGELKAEACSRHAKLVLTHFVKDAGTIAEDDRHAGNGIPDDVAEASEAGEVDADCVPVSMEGDISGRADVGEALRGLGDDAGVGDVELERGAGSEWLGERGTSGIAAS